MKFSIKRNYLLAFSILIFVLLNLILIVNNLKLKKTNLVFIDGDKINDQKLVLLSKMNYTEAKEILNINPNENFCIYFEDKNGKRISVANVDKVGASLDGIC